MAEKNIPKSASLPGFARSTLIVCLEHTGLYNAHALEVLFQAQLPIWLEAPLPISVNPQIKRFPYDPEEDHFTCSEGKRLPCNTFDRNWTPNR